MATTKISSQDWTTARLRWEGEPPCTFADLVQFLGLTRQAIGKRARKERWKKMLDMEAIVELARKKSDRHDAASNAEMAPSVSKQAAIVVGSEHHKSRQHENLPTSHQVDHSAVDIASAAILQRHRAEWVAVRNLLYMAIKTKDVEMSRTAKNAVDAMKKIQEGERDAWSMGAAGTKAALQIIVERHPGFRIVR